MPMVRVSNGGTLPNPLEIVVSTGKVTNNARWAYAFVPKEIANNYTKIRYSLIDGNVPAVKYGDILSSSTSTEYTTNVGTYGTDVTTTDTSLSILSNGLGLGINGNIFATVKFILSK